MSALTIRQAAVGDLDELQAIYYATQIEGEDAPPSRPPILLPALPHIMATGELLVVERDGRIMGFSGLISRGGVAFLTDLFVRPDVQSSGVGQALLERILPRDGRILATAASTDPRASALYIRAGMRPQAPLFWLLGDSSRVVSLAQPDVDMREADVDDPRLVEWDTALCGRPREEDLSCLVRGYTARPFWFERAGRRIGYGFVQQRSPEALWNQGAYALGPIGAYTPEDAAMCVLAAVEWARTHGEQLRIGILGAHPALPELLRAGMHIGGIEMFLASAPFVDGQRYVPSGGSLF